MDPESSKCPKIAPAKYKLNLKFVVVKPELAVPRAKIYTICLKLFSTRSYVVFPAAHLSLSACVHDDL